MGQSETYQLIKNYFSDKPVKKVSVFGSFARDEEGKNSDIDLIIQPTRPLGLITLGNYIADLEQLTHRKIDLATENSITPDFFHIIKKDLQVIYAA